MLFVADHYSAAGLITLRQAVNELASGLLQVSRLHLGHTETYAVCEYRLALIVSIGAFRREPD